MTRHPTKHLNVKIKQAQRKQRIIRIAKTTSTIRIVGERTPCLILVDVAFMLGTFTTPTVQWEWEWE